MFHLPDLRPLFYLAAFGFVCALLLAIWGGGWLAYHLFGALSLYLAG